MTFNLFTKSFAACLAVALVASPSFAQDAEPNAKEASPKALRVALDEDGTLNGRVFAMLDREEAPMVARVSLAADGKTVASGDTDVIGNFSFSDVEPGTYTMVGVSGEYVGDQVVVVTPKSDDEEGAIDGEGVYTSLALQVAPVDGFVDSSFVGVPMDSYAAPVSGCSTCGSDVSVGSSYGSCGGGCGGGGGGGFAGGSSLRRLALLGAAVAIPVAISGASPDE